MSSPAHASAPPLSTESVVETALRIADAEGLDALSMRRIATELGSSPMALYRHVEHKEALLDEIADHVFARLPELSPDEQWQEAVARWMTVFYDVLRDHPSVAHIMTRQPVRGEQTTRRGESVLECLLAGGIPDDQTVEILTTLIWYTLGAALYAVPRSSSGGAEDAGRFEDVPADRFPTLYRLRRHFTSDAGRDHFENGLRHLIRGYANQA